MVCRGGEFINIVVDQTHGGEGGEEAEDDNGWEIIFTMIPAG